MRLNNLPDVLFPNPIQHPNYKISFLNKVREEILNVIIWFVYRINSKLNQWEWADKIWQYVHLRKDHLEFLVHLL